MKRMIPVLMGVLFMMACSGPKDSKQAAKPKDLPPKRPVAAAPVKKDAPKPKKEVKKVAKKDPNAPLTPDEVRAQVSKFKPMEIGYPEKLITDDIKPVLRKLVEASKFMDEIFLLQVDPDNPATRREIAAAVQKDPAKAPVLQYFDIMFGPWDRLQHDRPFWGSRKKPLGAGFYDPSITKIQLLKHMEGLKQTIEKSKDAKARQEAQKELDAIRSLYTLVHRKDGKFSTVPYSQAYRAQLERAAKLLEEAAALTKDPYLKKYLLLRAKAFRTDDYRKSDFAWLDLKGPIEFLIGPYEVYEDKLMGYKAAFEATLNIVDPEYSKKLAVINKHAKELDRNLPYPESSRKLAQRGKTRPIVVVYELFTAGDTKAGIQTLAFNLPNDEVVRKQKGYKLVLYRNVSEAKFRVILSPIADKLLDPSQRKYVTFDAFFTNTLLHETTHGLGPAFVEVTEGKNKVRREVREMLRDTYSALEEAKADIGGLVGLEYLVRQGMYTQDMLKQGYVTYLAGFFRSVRFGISEAHGRANLMAFSYLMSKGAIVYDTKTERFHIDFARMPGACRDFVKELLDIQATGDYEKAKAFMAKWAHMPQSMRKALPKLADIPVDIKPEYKILKDMTSWK